jgi:hypothetical protein
LSAPEPLAPHTLFVARMETSSPLAPPVQIQMTAQDGERKAWSFAALAPDAAIVLDLTAWKGKEVTSVRLSSDAGPMEAGLGYARLLPPFPRSEQ